MSFEVENMSFLQFIVNISKKLYFDVRMWFILASNITEETFIVEMRIWCRKIGTVNIKFAYTHEINNNLYSTIDN